MSHLLLVGFMGAGKSSVGLELASRLDRPFVDLDREIEARTGVSVGCYFEEHGEAAFREIEHEVLGDLASAPASVVACGGGVVTRDDNRTLLGRLGHVIYLKVSAGEALARIGDTATRPLLAGSGGALAATRLLDAREALYAAVADVVVETSGAPVDEVVERVLAAVEEGWLER